MFWKSHIRNTTYRSTKKFRKNRESTELTIIRLLEIVGFKAECFAEGLFSFLL